MGKTRAQHLEEYERWAERVQPQELQVRGRSQELVDLLDEHPEAGAEADPPALAAGV
ncbi:MAG: hypothetical protein OXC06_00870 [Acidimicrobiaceae bacterium]|nr:hypothetical protein [Acidimicrobiaceae bacterium]